MNRLVCFAFLLAALLLLLSVACAEATYFTVQCEDYSNSHDIGGTPVSTIFCSAAFKLMAVEGVDLVGEWIEVPFDAPVEAQYTLHLTTYSPQGQMTRLKCSVSGTDQFTYLQFTGIGCG